MARYDESRAIKRIAEDIDDALAFNLPFIAAAEGDAWRQVQDLLHMIGRFADEASAPEPVWRDAEFCLRDLHAALLAAVSRGRGRARTMADPPSTNA